MKKTIQISDALWSDAKRIAAENQTTLSALVNQGLMFIVDREKNNTDIVAQSNQPSPSKPLVG